MYCGFFNLDEEPFNMKPDPRFLFLTQEHRERLAGLAYGVLNRKNCLVVTGDIGTGKTTLITAVTQYLPRERTRFSIISIPTLTSADLLEMILRNFGIAEVPASKAERIHTLSQFLAEGDARGTVSALIFDEAHKLSPDALEEIRLLGNLNLGLVLVGQNELTELLNRRELRALKQRICVQLTTGPLREDEVGQYIRRRWTAAGGGPASPFTPEATGAVAHWSGGVPRLINSICDNALTVAFKAGEHTVTLEHVHQAVARLKLARPSGPESATDQGGSSPAASAHAAVETALPQAALPQTGLKPRWTLRSVGARIVSQLPARLNRNASPPPARLPEEAPFRRKQADRPPLKMKKIPSRPVRPSDRPNNGHSITK